MLSCQPSSVATIKVTDEPHKGNKKGSMALTYKATNSVSYRAVPLTNFRTISMVMETSASAEATVTKKSKDLSGCWDCLDNCGCCDGCCENKWQATNKPSETKNDRCETL